MKISRDVLEFAGILALLLVIGLLTWPALKKTTDETLASQKMWYDRCKPYAHSLTSEVPVDCIYGIQHNFMGIEYEN